jgi:Flagellar basal body-associated protein FliL.
MRKLLPVLLLILGLGAGAGAGWFLKPAPAPMDEAAAHGEAPAHGEEATDEHGASASHYEPDAGPTETVRLPNQFVVPVIVEGRVQAMVVIGLALELTQEHEFSLATDEARLRAVFLQMLFDHANIGGFSGLFTSGEALLALRRILREAARTELGPEVQDVLITELLRQES